MRKAAYPIVDLILHRWSPRAMSGESISDEQLMRLFEAARWAPSSYNGQPWRFIYAKRDTPFWSALFNLIVPANQVWAKNAAVLVLMASRNKFTFNEKPARTHSFDAGSAWENLALQGHHDGLVIHGMEGFDYDRAKKELNIPDEYTVEMMFAVGKKAPVDSLPDQMRKNEKPSERMPIEKFVFEGSFKGEK